VRKEVESTGEAQHRPKNVETSACSTAGMMKQNFIWC